MDKDEAIKRIKNLISMIKSPRTTMAYCPEEMEALDLAIKTFETDRWIPVSERLPEEYGNYLVQVAWSGNKDIDMGTYHPRNFSKTSKTWSMCDADGFYWAEDNNIEVTHWRPLPQRAEEK